MSSLSMVRIASLVAALVALGHDAAAERCVTCWAVGCDPAMQARLPTCDPVAEGRDADRRSAKIRAQFDAERAAYDAKEAASDRRLSALLSLVGRARTVEEKASAEGDLERLLGERRLARDAKRQALEEAKAAVQKARPTSAKTCDRLHDPLCGSGL